MSKTPLAEQASGLISESFKDGVLSDGGPTEQEKAAAAANAPRKEAPAAAEGAAESQEEQDDEGGEGGAAGDGGQEGSGEGGAQEGEEGEQQPADDGKGKGAGKKSAAERIGDLTAARRSAEREADSQRTRAERAEAELAALKSGKTPLTTQDDTATSDPASPDPSQFDYGELDPKYIAALARYETAQALKAQRAEDDKARQTQAADARRQELGTKQDALVKAGVKLHDDFDEVVMQGAKDGKWELSQHLGELLLDSEFGAQIAYELAKDPDEAARVAKLSPVDQAKFLGRQEAKFEAAKSSQGKPPKAPQAPPPPKTPRGNSGSSKTGADSEDFASVEAAWRGGQFK